MESSEPTGNHETDQKKLVPFITQPQIKKETSNLKDKTATPVKNEMSSLKDNETSVAVIGLVTFVGDASRGILFPVLWLLVQRVGGDLTDLGWLVAMFSIGRFLIANPLGAFTDKYRHKLALIGSNVTLAFGAALWSNSEIVGGLIPLFFAQFIMGLGTGSLGVTRSYVVEQVVPAKRTFMLARLSALQYAGFAATPLLGSAMLAGGSTLSPYWTYALPAYLVVLLAVLDVVFLIYPFKDYEVREESVAPVAAGSLTDKLRKEIATGDAKTDVGDEEQGVKPEANTKAEDHEVSNPVRSSSLNSFVDNPDRTFINIEMRANPHALHDKSVDNLTVPELGNIGGQQKGALKGGPTEKVEGSNILGSGDNDVWNEKSGAYSSPPPVSSRASRASRASFGVSGNRTLSTVEILQQRTMSAVESLQKRTASVFDEMNKTFEAIAEVDEGDEERDTVNVQKTDTKEGDKLAITEAPSAFTAEAKAGVEVKANDDEEASKRDFAMIYTLMISLNFTTRGAIAVYETQGSQILLDQYGLSVLDLGLVVTVLGIVGTMQFIFFKQVWTSRFSDITLMVGGCGLMAVSQALVINWTSSDPTSIVRFILPQAIMYSFAYPVGNSAILGTFSKLQKKGRQAKAQGNFALWGSAARILMPVLSGYFESYVKATSSFALVQVMMAVSVMGMIYLQSKIVYYSDGTGDRNSTLTTVQWLWIAFFLIVALFGIVGMVEL